MAQVPYKRSAEIRKASKGVSLSKPKKDVGLFARKGGRRLGGDSGTERDQAPHDCLTADANRESKTPPQTTPAC